MWKTPITGVSVTDGQQHDRAPMQPCLVRRWCRCTSAHRGNAGRKVTDATAAVYGSGGDYAGCRGDGTNDGSYESGMIPIIVTGSHLRGVPFALVTDGTSNTIMIGEKHVCRDDIGNIATAFARDGVIWSGGEQGAFVRRAGASNPLAFDPSTVYNNQFGSWHTGVVQFVFGDATVRGLKNGMPGTTLGFLAHIKDGQPTPSLD